MNTTQDLITREVTPADILKIAKQYVAVYGWHQGGMFADASEPLPPACAVGAIRIAILAGTRPFPDEAHADGRSDLFANTVDVLAKYLINSGWVDRFGALLDGDPYEVVADWNDDSNRNVAQVLAALNGAAQDWDRIHTGGAR